MVSLSWVFCRARAVSCFNSLMLGSSREASSSFQLKVVLLFSAKTSDSTPVAIRSKSVPVSDNCLSSLVKSSCSPCFSASEVLAFSFLVVTAICCLMFFCRSTREASISRDSTPFSAPPSGCTSFLVKNDSILIGDSISSAGSAAGCKAERIPASRGGVAAT